MTRVILTVFLTFLSLPLAAQQVTGTITTDAHTWYLTADAGHSKSSWSGDEKTTIVTLFGHATDDTIKETQGALTIRFYLFEPMGARFVNEVDIIYYEDISKGAYVTKGHGDGSIIRLEDVQLSNNTLTLKGAFTVTLLFTDDFGVTLNADDTRQISGQFNVTLMREQKN